MVTRAPAPPEGEAEPEGLHEETRWSYRNDVFFHSAVQHLAQADTPERVLPILDKILRARLSQSRQPDAHVYGIDLGRWRESRGTYLLPLRFGPSPHTDFVSVYIGAPPEKEGT